MSSPEDKDVFRHLTDDMHHPEKRPERPKNIKKATMASALFGGVVTLFVFWIENFNGWESFPASRFLFPIIVPLLLSIVVPYGLWRDREYRKKQMIRPLVAFYLTGFIMLYIILAFMLIHR